MQQKIQVWFYTDKVSHQGPLSVAANASPWQLYGRFFKYYSSQAFNFFDFVQQQNLKKNLSVVYSPVAVTRATLVSTMPFRWSGGLIVLSFLYPSLKYEKQRLPRYGTDPTHGDYWLVNTCEIFERVELFERSELWRLAWGLWGSWQDHSFPWYWGGATQLDIL